MLSRCQVFVLKSLNKSELIELIKNAITKDIYLKEKQISLTETGALLRFSGGDARKLLNLLDIVIEYQSKGKINITNKLVETILQQNQLAYDKNGDMHYDIISAFIKSIRGSDPDATLYWLARMIEGGEKPEFIARRLIISASEDIGLANPNALLLANAAYDSVIKIGWPEARIILSEVAVYLAVSPKSNSTYLAIAAAIAEVKKSGNQPVPLHLRNAPTELMSSLGYHDGYKYPHDYNNNFTKQQYLPDLIKKERFWYPQHSAQEDRYYRYMVQCWDDKFKK